MSHLPVPTREECGVGPRLHISVKMRCLAKLIDCQQSFWMFELDYRAADACIPVPVCLLNIAPRLRNPGVGHEVGWWLSHLFPTVSTTRQTCGYSDIFIPRRNYETLLQRNLILCVVLHKLSRFCFPATTKPGTRAVDVVSENL